MFLVYIRSIQSSSSERWPWEEGNCTHLLIPTCPSKLLMKIWRKFELHSHSFQFKSYNLQLGWEELRMADSNIIHLMRSFIQVLLMKIYFWSLCAAQTSALYRQKHIKIMFLNCHCIREEKVLLVIVQIIYGLFCVHFILIRLSQGRPSAVLPVTWIKKNLVKLFTLEKVKIPACINR